MRALELAILYAVIGAGCALAIVVHARASALRVPLFDAALCLPFWPLYAPFLLLQRAAVTPPPAKLEVLGGEVFAALEARVAGARARVAEIDRVLAQGEFAEGAAEERVRALSAAGDTRAAEAAEARLAGIRRLVKLRGRFSRELTEVDERMAQLRVQAELVRLSGAADDATRELVAELVGRVEGLDAILDEECDQS